MADLVEELVELLAEDARALDCVAEIEGLRDILRDGTSADRQRRIHAEAKAAGKSGADAMRVVVADLVEEFGAGL